MIQLTVLETSEHFLKDYRVIDDSEECEVIGDILMENGIEVDDDDRSYLKYFTVKGEALFECHKCDSRWSSYAATIKVDLFTPKITRKYRQKCKTCEYWASPQFTRDQFQCIINRVIDKYNSRATRNIHHPPHSQEVFIIRTAPKPHTQELCERCQELGRPCWNQDVPNTSQQDD